MRASTANPVSSVPGILWPALPHAAGQTMLAMQFQLERSQWWSAEQLAARQLEQLRALCAFAVREVPYYRGLAQGGADIFDDPHSLTWERFARWPLIQKPAWRDQGDALLPRRVPPEHGRQAWLYTSGSTGIPVRSALSEVGQFLRAALTLRNQIWHDFDFSLAYGEIRAKAQPANAPAWGPATSVAFRTGPSMVYPVTGDIGAQLGWLLAGRPGYLQSMASNLRALVLHSRATGQRPAGLDAVLSYAENLPSDLRALVREEWGVRLIDTYSCTEAGVVALQCPDHEHYHVQSEAVIAEVLREDGSACAPGETGRLVLTDLANFAMPLIRYEIGDYAEAGAPCGCGRGLPVIARIRGRARNMAIDPTGRRFWPSIPAENWFGIAPLEQMQMVQHTPSHIEVRYTMARPLDASQQERLEKALLVRMGYPFELRFTRVERIERQPGEKFEEFINLCPS